MKTKFLYALLFMMGLSSFSYAQVEGTDGADITFDDGDKVIRCVPSKNRTGSVQSPMAWPKDESFDIGTTGTYTGGGTLSYMRYEVLFTVLKTNDGSNTGTVALGASYKYTGSKSLSAASKGSKCMVTQFKTDYDETAPPTSGATFDSGTKTAKVFIPSQIYVDKGKYEGYTFTVTSLSDEAFVMWSPTSDVDHIDLYLPETLTSIGNSALGGTDAISKLRDIKFYHVNDNGSPARDGSGNLIVGDQYNKVATIGDNAFKGKTKLTRLPMSRYTTTVGKNAFDGCTGLVQDGTIDLSPYTSLTNLPDGVFANLTQLSSLEIPSSVTHVGAIWGTNVDYASAPTYDDYLSDGRETFSLTGMTGVTDLDLRAFNRPGITEFELPANVTTITHGYTFDHAVYRENNFLTSADFSTNTKVTAIPDHCFDGARALTTVTFPSNNITEIGSSAFRNTDALSSISFPSSVTAIGKEAFYKSGLESIDLSATQVTSLSERLFGECPNLTGENIKLPESVTEIGDQCFEQCKELTTVAFLGGTNVKTIGNHAFFKCNITSLAGLPATVDSIGKYAYYNNELSGEFSIASNWKYIGENAFGTNFLTYMKMNPAKQYDKDLQIHQFAFGNQIGEFTVEFDDSCTTVPAYIKGCPFSVGLGYTDDEGESHPACLRVIVPINCVKTYRDNDYMGQVMESDYRVKFRWGTFTDADLTDNAAAESLDNTNYYHLYNITPQQRLIATSAWKNDILNFRPEPIGNTPRENEMRAKPTEFEMSSAKRIKTGRKKVVSKVVSEGSSVYSNTADYWNATDKKATVLPYDDNFFGADWKFNGPKTTAALETFKKSADGKNFNSYPKSLMPYTIHTFHSNHGNTEVEQLGRKPVTDGVVPYGTGIIIDFPMPGYYLVPPASVEGDKESYRKVYYVDEKGNLSNAQWCNLDDFQWKINSLYRWIDMRDTDIDTVVVDKVERFFATRGEDVEVLSDWGIFDDAGFYMNYNEEFVSTLSDGDKNTLREIISRRDSMKYETLQEAIDALEAQGYQIYDSDDEAARMVRDPDNPNEDYYGVGFDKCDVFSHQDQQKEIHEYHFNYLVDLGDITPDNTKLKSFTDNNHITWTKAADFVRKFRVYTINGGALGINITREFLENCPNEYESVDFENLEVRDWIDIDDHMADMSFMVNQFHANHDPENDHNVIIGLPDRYPIFPYWAASPYPFIDAAHDDNDHPTVKSRFTGTLEGGSSNPLNFNYTKYGRMGEGGPNDSDAIPTNYGEFVNIKEVEEGKASLDDDIHYVNFGISQGYFVQVKSNPLASGDQSKWTQPNRAYFSISRAHMPHIFDSNSSGDAKLAIFIIPDDDGDVTGINTIDDSDVQKRSNAGWYTLQGVRLNDKPTKPGIYIHNGRKEIVK